MRNQHEKLTLNQSKTSRTFPTNPSRPGSFFTPLSDLAYKPGPPPGITRTCDPISIHSRYLRNCRVTCIGPPGDLLVSKLSLEVRLISKLKTSSGSSSRSGNDGA